MLNKSQSRNRNLVKYAIIVPLLAAFMLYFQVKVIAQARNAVAVNEAKSGTDNFTIVIDRNSTDADMKADAEKVKKYYGVTVKISKVKRNKDGEIIRIKITYKDKDGQTGTTEYNSDKPINSISLTKNDEGIAFHTSSGNSFRSDNKTYVLSLQDNDDEVAEAVEAPEAPEAPEMPEMPEAVEAPEMPEMPAVPNTPGSISTSKSISITQNGTDDPIIIVNGKRIKSDVKTALAGIDPNLISGIEVIKEPHMVKAFGGNDNNSVMLISIKENGKLVKEAMEQARQQMKNARLQMERTKPDMEKMRLQMQMSKPDMEKAKQEMIQAKEEMLKAKAEMQKAKAELDKTREELKKQK